MRKILVLSIVIIGIFTFTACSGSETKVSSVQKEDLYVFAAASLTGCFTQMAGDFEKAVNGKVKVVLNFAGSQALRTSIEAGAKADIFASADLKNIEELESKGFIRDHAIFAKNKLTLVQSTGSKFNINSLADLGAAGLKLAVADKSVPVGSYWEKAYAKALKDGAISAGEKASIDKNIVTRELNVKDVLSKVLLNEADAGIVYVTDAVSADKSKVKEVAVPFFDLVTADYPVAVLKGSKSQYAGKLLDYILSEKGKQLLKKYGFIVE